MKPIKSVTLIPVYVDGEVQLWDIRVNGKWIGSRRTFKQAWDPVEFVLRGSSSTGQSD